MIMRWIGRAVLTAATGFIWRKWKVRREQKQHGSRWRPRRLTGAAR